MADSFDFEYQILRDRYSIYRLSPDAPMPDLEGLEFVSVSRSASELSIVAPTGAVEPGQLSAPVKEQPGYRAVCVAEQLDFQLVGVLAWITARLAAQAIPVLAISTFDTDYLLVPEAKLTAALDALQPQQDGRV